MIVASGPLWSVQTLGQQPISCRSGVRNCKSSDMLAAFFEAEVVVMAWMARSRSTASVLCLALAAAAACGKKKEAPPPPPPTVQVAPVVQKDIAIYQEWIGTLDGNINADIRPQIEGYVLKRVYNE